MNTPLRSAILTMFEKGYSVSAICNELELTTSEVETAIRYRLKHPLVETSKPHVSSFMPLNFYV